MDPINYGALQTQLDLSPIRQGFALRDQRNQAEAYTENQREIRQLAQAKFTEEQEQNAEYQQALSGFAADPTPAAMLEISARFPDHSKALQEGFKTYTAGQQRDIIGTAVNVLGAAQAGNTELAAKTLTERRDALKRAGIDTSHTDAALDLIKSEDPAKRKQGIAYMATVLSGAVGAEDAAKIMENFGVGAKAEGRAADNERAAAQAAETARHNRVMEGQGEARVGLSRAAGARAGAKKAGAAKKGSFSDSQLDALLN